jgi:hypothetical protein
LVSLADRLLGEDDQKSCFKFFHLAFFFMFYRIGYSSIFERSSRPTSGATSQSPTRTRVTARRCGSPKRRWASSIRCASGSSSITAYSSST